MNLPFNKENLKPLLPLISGILSGVSAYFKALNPLIFVSLTPLLLKAFEETTSRGMVKTLLLFSIGYYPILFLWFYQLSPEQNELFHTAIVTAGILIFSMLQGLLLSAALMLFPFIKTGKLRDVFTFSLLYILGEWFQEITPLFPFPWARLSGVFASFSPWLQSASVLGNLFLSFLILAINGLLSRIILSKSKKEILLPLVFLIILPLANLAFGYFRLNLIKEETETNVSFIDKLNLSESFPSPIVVLTKEQSAETLEFKNLSDTTILFMDGNAPNPLRAVFPESYTENQSRRFAMPYGDEVSFGGFSRGMGINKVFSKRRGISVLNTPKGTAGGVFGYEAVYPLKLRKTANQGASFIVAFSGDASKASFQSERNLKELTLRAIETGKPILLAKSESPLIISLAGKPQRLSPYGDYAYGSFLGSSKSTIYSVTGDIIAVPALVFWIRGILKKHSSKGKAFSAAVDSTKQ